MVGAGITKFWYDTLSLKVVGVVIWELTNSQNCLQLERRIVNFGCLVFSVLLQYVQLEILESRVLISCPECSELLHPNDIYALLADQPNLILKYEAFLLRRVLMADPDTRWCPAPDCWY